LNRPDAPRTCRRRDFGDTGYELTSPLAALRFDFIAVILKLQSRVVSSELPQAWAYPFNLPSLKH